MKLLIIGAGGHGRCCLDIARSMNIYDDIAFLDDGHVNEVINDCKVIGLIDEMTSYYIEYEHIFIAIGNNVLRKCLINQAKSIGYTIDSLIKPIGKLGLRDSRVDKVMLEWSRDSNFCLIRVAIEHQLLRKKNMNAKLLNTILENNLGQEEFFINKAIGWALRDYSKTDPTWVQGFIQTHQDEMASLSIKEGSKYL